MLGFGGDRKISISATTNAADVSAADIVFVQCKANFNADAAESVKHLFDGSSETVAISFQNGLGNEEQLAEFFGEANVLGGLTAQGANIEGPGVVRNHAGVAIVYWGDVRRYFGQGAVYRGNAVCGWTTDQCE